MFWKRISQASSFSFFTEALPHYTECVSCLFSSNEVLLMSKRQDKWQRWGHMPGREFLTWDKYE